MSLFRTPPRPTPEGWRAVQTGTKELPREVLWPANQCSRCKIHGQMEFSTGKALCSDCAATTRVETASPLGLHERRGIKQLQA